MSAITESRKNELYGLAKGWLLGDDGIFETWQVSLEMFGDAHNLSEPETDWVFNNVVMLVGRND